MQNFEAFNNKLTIGTIDVSREKAGEVVLDLASQFGMTNPVNPVSSARKGIIVKKNGKKYTITLTMFTPPVILNWTSPFDLSNLNQVIEDIANNHKKIGFINILKVNNGKDSLCQIAIS